MTRNVASAVFDSRNEAERAIAALRAQGVSDRSISALSRHDDDFQHEHDHGDHVHTDTKASGTGKGIAIGAGTGALAGLAALAIPGVGPFLAMGAVAEAIGVVGSAAATSAVVGGAIGGLTGALMKYGVDEDDARYFEDRIQKGGYWVGVDLDDSGANRNQVQAILDEHRGMTARTATTTTTTPSGTARY